MHIIFCYFYWWIAEHHNLSLCIMIIGPLFAGRAPNFQMHIIFFLLLLDRFSIIRWIAEHHHLSLCNMIIVPLFDDFFFKCTKMYDHGMWHTVLRYRPPPWNDGNIEKKRWQKWEALFLPSADWSHHSRRTNPLRSLRTTRGTFPGRNHLSPSADWSILMTTRWYSSPRDLVTSWPRGSILANMLDYHISGWPKTIYN